LHEIATTCHDLSAIVRFLPLRRGTTGGDNAYITPGTSGRARRKVLDGVGGLGIQVVALDHAAQATAQRGGGVPGEQCILGCVSPGGLERVTVEEFLTGLTITDHSYAEAGYLELCMKAIAFWLATSTSAATTAAARRRSTTRRLCEPIVYQSLRVAVTQIAGPARVDREVAVRIDRERTSPTSRSSNCGGTKSHRRPRSGSSRDSAIASPFTTSAHRT
jgi:hypothetical protein